MRTKTLHPYRVLIVEDELKDWAYPMKEALEKIASKEEIIGNIEVDIAEDKQQAEAYLARYNYHLTSLDMRIPERKGELLSIDPGLNLARAFPWVGFPKLLIYSQTLRMEEHQHRPKDSMMVLRVPTDLYAKPTGGDADQEQNPIETLSVKAWAQRVAESLFVDDLKIKPSSNNELHLTVIGAYLNYGVGAIPPFLASHLQVLANHWTDRSSDRVEAAIGFIETTARLALVQSAVLCQAQGEDTDLPFDDRMVSCLKHLENLRQRLSGWNWCNYLKRETIQAFQDARRERNEKVHSTETLDSQKRWAGLRSPLQYAMDLAAFWVRHPLVVDLRYSRDGWSAELLVSTANPRSRHPLPQEMDFPTEADRSVVWQNVWTMSGEGTGKKGRKAISWENFLIPDPQTAAHWWFPICQQGRSKTYIDLISGSKRIFP